MPKIKNIVGEKFGALTAIKQSGRKGRSLLWLCKCSCGKEIYVAGGNLKSGNTSSCGCIKHVYVTHGLSKSKTYTTWQEIKKRCINKNNKSYINYGGRGISICSRWKKFENFF